VITTIDQELYDRAARIFGKNSTGGIYWPHGTGTPQKATYRSDDGPERYEAAVAHAHEAQRVIVDWAEAYGLKTSEAGCCPKWLLRGRSMRCTSQRNRCTRYGSDSSDSEILDHGTAWIKDTKPVALTSALYAIDEEDQARIAWWMQQDDRLRSAQGIGWYGSGTTQVIIWRSDLIDDIAPAPLAG
jgi:hypothetical protein